MTTEYFGAIMAIKKNAKSEVNPSMANKKATFSLSEKTIEELNQLTKSKQLSKSVIVSLAIENYKREEERREKSKK